MEIKNYIKDLLITIWVLSLSIPTSVLAINMEEKAKEKTFENVSDSLKGNARDSVDNTRENSSMRTDSETGTTRRTSDDTNTGITTKGTAVRTTTKFGVATTVGLVAIGAAVVGAVVSATTNDETTTTPTHTTTAHH